MSSKNNQYVSVVIVNYNSTKHLNKLLKSTQKIETNIGEIIIIDNDSKVFEEILNIPRWLVGKVIILKNQTNFGFSKAVNRGIKIAKHKLILLLNPDTQIIDNSISSTIQIISNNKDIGLIGGKLISEETGNEQPTANTKPTALTAIFEFTILKKIFPNNRFTKKFWPEKDKHISSPIEVESLCGAFIIFRKEIKKQKIRFDENYFLYLEDLDFGTEIKNNGLKVIFDPNSKVVHKGGASSNSRYNIELKHWYDSRNYYFTKHLNNSEAVIIKMIFKLEFYLLKIFHKLRKTPEY
ncbi:MAG: glycosyltransferase family 2 protein [Candidatus Shapirobacteria bacterium]|jgi:hypothetical protein